MSNMVQNILIQIKSLTEKYDEDIGLLKDAVADMQLLLKNPQKLVELISNPVP